MNEIREFKNKIFKKTFFIATLVWLGSLIPLGFNIRLLYGLALGSCISVVNFNLLSFMSYQALRKGRPALALLGTNGSLIIYGFVLYMALIKGREASFFGCFFGIIAQKLSIIWICGIRTKFSADRKLSPELQAYYDEMDQEREEKKAKNYS